MTSTPYLHRQWFCIGAKRFHTFRSHRVKPIRGIQIYLLRDNRLMSFQYLYTNTGNVPDIDVDETGGFVASISSVQEKRANTAKNSRFTFL